MPKSFLSSNFNTISCFINIAHSKKNTYYLKDKSSYNNIFNENTFNLNNFKFYKKIMCFEKF